MGSAVQYLSFNAPCPFLVIKDKQLREEKKGERYRFALCDDGSEYSNRGLDFLTKMIDKEKDEVLAITCKTSKLDMKAIQEHAE